MTQQTLFNSDLLDQLEGLNERYALLTRQIEALQGEAAVYDKPPDANRLANFEEFRGGVKVEVVALLEDVLRELG